MKNNLNELLKTLRKETMVMSSPNQMAETKSYKEIEKEGKVFVPFLIESLGKEDMPTIAILGLLHKLTGETPFTPDKRGHIDEMIAAWKVWKPKSLKEEATQIILESAKKREKKTAKPIPHEDIGDPNQKILAAENTKYIVETLPPDASASDFIHDFVHSRSKTFKGDNRKQRIFRALGASYSKRKHK